MTDRQRAGTPSAVPPRRRLVAPRGRLPGLPAQLRRQDGDGVGDLPGIIDHLDHLGPDGLGVDAIWLSPIYPSPGLDVGYDVSDHTAHRPAVRDRGGLRPARRRGPPPRDAGDPRPRHEPHQRRAPVVRGVARVARRRRTPTGTCGAIRPGRRAAGRRCRRTTGCRGSAARPGRASRGAASSTTTRSSPSSPTSNWRKPAVEAAQLDDGPGLARPGRRRLPPRRLQRRSSSTPTCRRTRTRRGSTAWDRQVHVYDRDQPDLPELLGRFRAIVDAEPGPDDGRRAVRRQRPSGAAALTTEPPSRLRLGALIAAPWSARAFRAAIDARERLFGPERWPTRRPLEPRPAAPGLAPRRRSARHATTRRDREGRRGAAR